MVSIVAIGIAWLVSRAMMTATGGVGGRTCQVAAVILTYVGCSFGDVVAYLIEGARHHMDVMGTLSANVVTLAVYGVAGPFLTLKESPLNGGLGLLILFFGLRTAWRMAAGSPGFGSGQPGARINPFGLR